MRSSYGSNATITRFAVLAGSAALAIAPAAFAAPTPAPLPIRVAVHKNQNAPHTFVLHHKMSEKYGLAPTIVTLGSSRSSLAALASNSIDVADVGIDSFVSALSQGAPLTTIAVSLDSSRGEGIVARNTIGSIEDLRGKAIAAPKDSGAYVELVVLLRKHHMTIDDVKFVDIRPPAMGPAWTRGDIDAASVWAPWMFEFSDSHVLGTWVDIGRSEGDVWVARTAFLKSSPETAYRFVAAVSAGVQALRDDPGVGAQVFAKHLGQPEQVVQKTLAATSFPTAQEQLDPKYALNFVAPNGLAATARSEAREALKLGLIKSMPNLGGAIDAAYLKRYVASLPH